LLDRNGTATTLTTARRHRPARWAGNRACPHCSTRPAAFTTSVSRSGPAMTTYSSPSHLTSACGPVWDTGRPPAPSRRLDYGRVSPAVPTSCPSAWRLAL
jgi:hypothetical protein